MSLGDDQIELYSRQIILRELGGVGQRHLLDASVLALGGGAARDTALSYLAGAGVGVLDVLPVDAADDGSGLALALAPLAERGPDTRLRVLSTSDPAAPPPTLDAYDVVLTFPLADAAPPAPEPGGGPRLGSIVTRVGEGGRLEVVLLPRGSGCLACLAPAPNAAGGPAPAPAELGVAGALAALAACRWIAKLARDDAARALRLDGASTWNDAAVERRASCPRGCPPPAQPV